MSSSYFNSSAPNHSGLHDGRWQGPLGDVLVALKHSSNARDVRDVLLTLVYALVQEPTSSKALCLLSQSRFTRKRLLDELASFRAVLRPDLADRIALAAMDNQGQLFGELPQDSPAFRKHLQERVRQELGAGTTRVSRQSVKSHLAHLWLDGQSLQTQSAIRRDTRASHPTVSAALNELAEQDLLGADRMTLQEPTWDAWRRLAETHATERTVLRFVDPSGLARTPIDMAKKLAGLQARGIAQTVAVGGVLGALHYDAHLNVTAASRLDVSVYDGDTGFVRQLDAGLVASDDKTARAVLVVHLSPSGEQFAPSTKAGRVAPPLECLADLLEIGLTAEARDFALALNSRAKARRSQVGTT
jgi:hypothetical protein